MRQSSQLSVAVARRLKRALDKKLYPTLSLSTHVYKMGTGDILLGIPATDSHPIQGEVAILSVALCYRNWDKFRPCGPPWLACDFTYLFT